MSTGFQNGIGAGKNQDSIQIDRKVEQLLARMTLAENIGQMTQIDRRYLKNESDIRVHYPGSVFSGGGSTPADNAAASWADVCDDYQSYAQHGDVLALEASDYTGKILGIKLADAVAYSSPEAIILVGGLAVDGEFISKPSKYHMEENLLVNSKKQSETLVA